MLRAYIDDSNIGQGPVAVLAGWVALAKNWARFSVDWDAVLRMSPRIEYFKWQEAWAGEGQFKGISKERRDEKINLLIGVIEEHEPLGIACAIPNQFHRDIFKENPDRTMRSPYFMAFHSVVTQLAHFLAKQGVPGPKVDFVFDIQPGEMDAAYAAWEKNREIASDEIKAVIGNVIFQTDTAVIPLQAADLSAGWTREQCEATYFGRELRNPPWGNRARNIPCLLRYWTPELFLEFAQRTGLVIPNPTKSVDS